MDGGTVPDGVTGPDSHSVSDNIGRAPSQERTNHSERAESSLNVCTMRSERCSAVTAFLDENQDQWRRDSVFRHRRRIVLPTVRYHGSISGLSSQLSGRTAESVSVTADRRGSASGRNGQNQDHSQRAIAVGSKTPYPLFETNRMSVVITRIIL